MLLGFKNEPLDCDLVFWLKYYLFYVLTGWVGQAAFFYWVVGIKPQLN